MRFTSEWDWRSFRWNPLPCKVLLCMSTSTWPWETLSFSFFCITLDSSLQGILFILVFVQSVKFSYLVFCYLPTFSICHCLNVFKKFFLFLFAVLSVTVQTQVCDRSKQSKPCATQVITPLDYDSVPPRHQSRFYQHDYQREPEAVLQH